MAERRGYGELGLGIVLTAVPLAFPAIPPFAWYVLLLVGCILILHDGALRFIAWWNYAPTREGAPSIIAPVSADQPVIVLMKPTRSYNLIWDAAKDLQPMFYVSRVGGWEDTREIGWPTFLIKNVGKEVATPLILEWSVGDFDLEGAVKKSSLLQNYNAVVSEKNLAVFTAKPSDEFVAFMTGIAVQAKATNLEGSAYSMGFSRISKMEIPYLAPEINNTGSKEIGMPIQISNFLTAFSLASVRPHNMTEPDRNLIILPIFVTATWKTPKHDAGYKYRIDAK